MAFVARPVRSFFMIYVLRRSPMPIPISLHRNVCVAWNDHGSVWTLKKLFTREGCMRCFWVPLSGATRQIHFSNVTPPANTAMHVTYLEYVRPRL